MKTPWTRLWALKLYWLLPLILAAVLLGLVLLADEAGPLRPFLYGP